MSDHDASADALVLHWKGKLFSAEDVRRHWHGQRELILSPRALLTPLAVDELRAKGVRVTRQEESPVAGDAKGWAYGQESPDPLITAASAALERDGLAMTRLDAADRLQAIRGWIAGGAGCVWFCLDAALMCCLANKVAGARAAAVRSGLEARRALSALGANVLIVEMPGATFFEVRQILRSRAGAGAAVCPRPLATLLAELENDAHR